MDLCEMLGLDSEIVRAHAEAYYGYMQVLSHAEQRKHSPSSIALMSHYAAIAASYWCVSEPSRAADTFTTSSKYASQQARLRVDQRAVGMGHSLAWRLRAAVLGACGDSFDFTDELFKGEFPYHDLSPRATNLTILLAARANFNRPGHPRMKQILNTLVDHAQDQRVLPVGVLQLPLSFTIHLAEFSTSLQKQNAFDGLSQWAFEFGKRLDERIGLAQATRSQWRQLYCRLLPIEPEALLAVATWRDMLMRNVNDMKPVEDLGRNMSKMMSVYLEVARIIFQGDPPKERKSRPTSRQR